MEVTFANLYVLHISLFCVGSVFGTPKVILSSPNEYDGILNYNFEDESKKYILNCNVTERDVINRGVIKWFRVNGNLHTYLDNLNLESYALTSLKAQDHNDSIYCLLMYNNEYNVSTEIISNRIVLNSMMGAGKDRNTYDNSQGVEIKMDIRKEILLINGSEFNLFHVSCEPSKQVENMTKLEIYKNIDGVATFVNDSVINESISVATGTIKKYDNNTVVYCRGVIKADSETFYSSNYYPLFIDNQGNEMKGSNNSYQSVIANDQCNVESKQSDSENNRSRTVIIAVSVSVTIILLMTAIIFFARKKCRSALQCRIHRGTESKVLYAEIQVSEQSNSDIPRRDETPYAEIVGVLYPANNNNNNNKPRTKLKKQNKVPVEESPYAVPYVNHYSIPVK